MVIHAVRPLELAHDVNQILSGVFGQTLRIHMVSFPNLIGGKCAPIDLDLHPVTHGIVVRRPRQPPRRNKPGVNDGDNLEKQETNSRHAGHSCPPYAVLFFFKFDPDFLSPTSITVHQKGFRLAIKVGHCYMQWK
jgi:hypothetical protein